jgi:hypothetical protein
MDSDIVGRINGIELKGVDIPNHYVILDHMTRKKQMNLGHYVDDRESRWCLYKTVHNGNHYRVLYELCSLRDGPVYRGV